MLKVYLAGEIHTNWREEIIENCKKENYILDDLIIDGSPYLINKNLIA